MYIHVSNHALQRELPRMAYFDVLLKLSLDTFLTRSNDGELLHRKIQYLTLNDERLSTFD